MDELERIKSDINLTEYAATLGYQLDRRESSRNSVVMRHPVSDDKIVISRAERDRHWIYFSVRDGTDHGTIVDFVCRRSRCSLSEACRELTPWITGLRPQVPPQLYRATVDPRRVDRDGACVDYERARAITNSAYLNARAIRPETIHHPRFAGNLREDSRGRVLFPHRDEDGFAGFESKYHGWTSFSAGGVKALWCSAVLPIDTRLVLVESAIDALSHFQIYRDGRTRYASTAGTLSPHQQDVLRAALRMLPAGAVVSLAFDRDVAGDKLAEQVRSLGGASFDRIKSPIGKDWNEYLNRRERAFGHHHGRTGGPCRGR